jgi:hypothetical protein
LDLGYRYVKGGFRAF